MSAVATNIAAPAPGSGRPPSAFPLHLMACCTLLATPACEGVSRSVPAASDARADAGHDDQELPPRQGDARGSDGVDSGPETLSPTLDAGPPPCDADAVLLGFGTGVRPYIGPCKACHDMTATLGLLKAPGPTWFHPSDDAASARAVLDLGLVDRRRPWRSLFILKPLATEDGGVVHTGGTWFSGSAPAFTGFSEFVEAASHCDSSDFSPARRLR